MRSGISANDPVSHNVGEAWLGRILVDDQRLRVEGVANNRRVVRN